MHNVLKVLDADAVEKTFTNWAKDVCDSQSDFADCFDAVAIDGKTMRASQKSGAAISHLLSLFLIELGLHLHTSCQGQNQRNTDFNRDPQKL